MRTKLHLHPYKSQLVLLQKRFRTHLLKTFKAILVRMIPECLYSIIICSFDLGKVSFSPVDWKAVTQVVTSSPLQANISGITTVCSNSDKFLKYFCFIKAKIYSKILPTTHHIVLKVRSSLIQTTV